MVEGARLESVYTGFPRIEGSNPSLSANCDRNTYCAPSRKTLIRNCRLRISSVMLNLKSSLTLLLPMPVSVAVIVMVRSPISLSPGIPLKVKFSDENMSQSALIDAVNVVTVYS